MSALIDVHIPIPELDDPGLCLTIVRIKHMYDQIFHLLFTNHIYYQSWNQSIPCSFIWFMLNIGSPSARLSIMRLCLTVIIALYISVSPFRKKPIRFVYICQCVVYTRTFKDADRFFSSQPFCITRGGSETRY